jgi:hypothetical protein
MAGGRARATNHALAELSKQVGGCTVPWGSSAWRPPRDTIPSRSRPPHAEQEVTGGLQSQSGPPFVVPRGFPGPGRFTLHANAQHGPKAEGTYVLELRTADGDMLAISVPRGETAVLRYFQERMPYGLYVPDGPSAVAL